jgi:hypothetical protein
LGGDQQFGHRQLLIHYTYSITPRIQSVNRFLE